MEDALIELVKQGAPLARFAISCHYAARVFGDVLLAALIGGIAIGGYRLIRNWQRFEFEE